MNKTNIQNLNVDLEKSIEKVFKKYILEVDDAIEAHGFKASTYIDYAEDTIFELKDCVKKQLSENGREYVIENLEENLENTITDIVKYTKQTSIERKEHYSEDKLIQKSEQLQVLLNNLNQRCITSIMEAI